MRLLTAALLALTAAPALAQVSVADVPLGAHPADEYGTAVALFNAGDRLRGGCLFYRAQFRFRLLVAAHPGSGDGPLMDSLNDAVGRPINEWLGGDVDDWLAAIDCAAAWAQGADDPLTPRARFPEQHARVLQGLLELRAMIAADPAAIRAERQAMGLPNR